MSIFTEYRAIEMYSNLSQDTSHEVVEEVARKSFALFETLHGIKKEVLSYLDKVALVLLNVKIIFFF